MTERIGILGGTFDPVHYGHLAIAEEARVTLTLDRVILIPAARQPFKRHVLTAEAQHRLAMVQLACAGNAAFEPSALEIERAGVSYTATTLETLHQTLGGELYFILGADALADLPRWDNVNRILQLACIVAFGRPQAATSLETLYSALPDLAQKLIMLEGPRMELSSTMLRERVATGRPIRYMVPDTVAEYVSTHGLYRSKTLEQ